MSDWVTYSTAIIRCKGLQAGNRTVTNDNVVVSITQASGNVLAASTDFDVSLLAIFDGQLSTGVVAEVDSTTGQALMTRCSSPDGTAFAINFAKVSTFAPNGQGLSGAARVTILASGLSNAHFTCKARLHRISTVDPGLPSCPYGAGGQARVIGRREDASLRLV